MVARQESSLITRSHNKVVIQPFETKIGLQDSYKQLFKTKTQLIAIPGTGSTEPFVVKSTGGAQPNAGETEV